VALAFTIGGVISRIAVHEGSTIRQGQLLAELTPVQIGSEVTKAEQGRIKAARDLARVTALHADSVATTEQLQDATTALVVAEQDLRIARFSQEHAVVRAPANGVVLRRMAEPSQVVQPGTPVLLVRSSQRGVVLRAGLPDRDAVRVRLGDEAEVRFDALPGERFRARLTQLASAASPGSGTYDVELTLEARAQTLASGLIGRAEIRTRAEAPVPALPLEALVEANGDSGHVFVVAPGGERATRRLVRIGGVVDNVVAITAGVELGDWVVIRGAAYLDDGARVAIRRAPPAAPEVP
jgi:RND family efflux transporter MFP subunit